MSTTIHHEAQATARAAVPLVTPEAKPESRSIVLHLHFEGTVAECERQRRDGKHDAVNSALQKVTSLNVRHTVSAEYLHACSDCIVGACVAFSLVAQGKSAFAVGTKLTSVIASAV